MRDRRETKARTSIDEQRQSMRAGKHTVHNSKRIPNLRLIGKQAASKTCAVAIRSNSADNKNKNSAQLELANVALMGGPEGTQRVREREGERERTDQGTITASARGGVITLNHRERERKRPDYCFCKSVVVLSHSIQGKVWVANTHKRDEPRPSLAGRTSTPASRPAPYYTQCRLARGNRGACPWTALNNVKLTVVTAYQ